MPLNDRSRLVLSEREFHEEEPLSIATGVAIVSALGRLAEAKDKHPPVLDHDRLLIHTRTLYRNLLGSMPASVRNDLTAYTLAEAIATECRVIESLVNEVSGGKCKVEFYECSYKTIANDFSQSLIRYPKTKIQKFLASLEHTTLLELKDSIVNKPEITYYNRKFKEYGGDCLILTHYPVDLLNRYRFRNLRLLESHTGAIKGPALYNTKLREGWGLQALPFDRMTLQLFGDGVHFGPMDVKLKMAIFNLAIKHDWAWATTKDYVIHCVVQKRDPALEVFIKNLYRK